MKLQDFEASLLAHLPTTYALLLSSNLAVHPAVSRVVVHGSRGLAGGYRPDSDIDLSLIVEMPPALSPPERDRLLHAIWEATLAAWQSPIELDLALVFDARGCGLQCFDQPQWDASRCGGGVDCFGLYKAMKGFNGLITDAGIQVQRMLPCLTIWRRA
ncbi:MAG TPA: nucleotidyltransferase domain-containing protein [Anaerolineae bacterium]|nr:nucleotidyltransferase domain-containing protein [Anaerolineae bacterium]